MCCSSKKKPLQQQQAPSGINPPVANQPGVPVVPVVQPNFAPGSQSAIGGSNNQLRSKIALDKRFLKSKVVAN